jgi:hypothetical protein
VDVDLHGLSGEQFLDARDVVAEEMTAHVILMRVGHQRAGEAHVLRGRQVRDGVDLPGGIHHHALAAGPVAHEIHEVLHRPQLDLLEVEPGSRHQYPLTHTR